jgi:GT2 family glycosyltransferase
MIDKGDQCIQTKKLSNRDAQYAQWLRGRELPERGQWRRRTNRKPGIMPPIDAPRFSIVMPTYNSQHGFLTQAIRSVINQSFSAWQLVIVDDGSTSSVPADVLRSNIVDDPRIAVQFQPTNRGIAEATQAAINLSLGEFVGFLDHDDLLWPNALQAVADALDRSPQADIVYTDEDKIDAHGRHYDPFFKPDWSPHLHYTCHYTNHFTIIRRTLIDLVGGMNPAMSGSQDYDLMLRASEKARRIVHVPEILYSWRAAPGSAALSIRAKPYAHVSAERALSAALERRGVRGTVVPGIIEGRWRIRRTLEPEPLVSIIIPTITKDFLIRCVKPLLSLTTYVNYQVVIINNSDDKSLFEACRELAFLDTRVRVVQVLWKPFNYSLLNNEAVQHCEGDFLCFLNDDTEIIDGDWLGALMEVAIAPDVGVVGAQLLYPDRSVQHAGVVLGIGGVANHAFRYFPPHHAGANGLRFMTRDVSAVTFACALVRRRAFEQVGGLDHVNVPVSFSDVDFCLRVGEAGYRLVYTPHAVLIHHESATRGVKGHIVGEAYMRERWNHVLLRDPYYNPHLTLRTEDYGISLISSVGFIPALTTEVRRLASRVGPVLATDGFGAVLQKSLRTVLRFRQRMRSLVAL